MSLDFLERPPQLEPDPIFDGFTEQLQLLRQVVRELKKTNPNQRAIVDLQFASSITNALDGPDDRVTAQFLNQRKSVKSLYLAIASKVDTPIAVGINEPVINGSSGISKTGIIIPAYTTRDIYAEVEFIEIGLVTEVSGLLIGINNSLPGFIGHIQIYAWTIPEEGKFLSNVRKRR